MSPLDTVAEEIRLLRAVAVAADEHRRACWYLLDATRAGRTPNPGEMSRAVAASLALFDALDDVWTFDANKGFRR